MPKIDLTFTVTAIIGIIAFVSPVATTLINNHYQLKFKRAEFNLQTYERNVVYKQNIYENYLRYLNALFQNPKNEESLSGYAQYYPLAYIYLPNEIRQKMSAINQKIANSPSTYIAEEIDELATDISTELNTISQQYTQEHHIFRKQWLQKHL